MTKTSLLNYIFIFVCSFTFGQVTPKDSSISNNRELTFYTPKKAIHLHLNKTTYISGENLWFRAYIYNRNQNIISNDNENLSVELFNQNKKKISSKTLAFINGSAYGNFNLSDSIPSGNYYIRAYIPEMSSHRFDESFNQKIEILNLSDENILEKNKTAINPKYDIQILPEGGHLINDILNTCGIKIIDQNGLGVDFDDIYLIDNNDNIITNVDVNQFGHGKFSFIPQTNSSYFIEVKTNTKTIRKELPNSLIKGILMSANHNYQKEQLTLKLQTNTNKSIKSLSNNWNLLIRKDNQLKEIAINPNHENTEHGIVIPYHTFFSGVNTITLLDNETPILERQVFIYKNIDTVAIKEEQVIRNKDSIEFTLKNSKNLIGNYSISILPQRTIANSNRNTIYNSFLLEPYINGRIENPSYYFENITTKVKYDMDLLMLTQGWSKYKWEYLTQDNTEHKNTFGYDITGKVNPDTFSKKGLKVLLASNGNNMKLAEVDENKEFYFKDLNLTKDNIINLTLVDKKGKATQSRFSYNVLSKNKNLKFLLPFSPNEKTLKNDIDEFYKKQINDSINELDEVLVTGNKSRRAKFFSSFLGGKIDSTYYGLGTIRNFMSSIAFGFPFDELDANVSIGSINGVPFYPRLHEWIPIEYVEDLFYRQGGGSTSRNPNGTPPILIIFLKGKIPTPKSLQKTKHFTLSKGFDTSKEFYLPLYDSFTSTDYGRYGVVWWLPNITSKENGDINFKIPNEAYSSFKLFIEGFTEDNLLVSDVIDVKLNSKIIN